MASDDPFADLIPVRASQARAQVPGDENYFDDLLPPDPLRPRGPSGETQEVNIAAKGDRRPGDRIRPNLATTFAQGALTPWVDEAVSGAAAPFDVLKSRIRGEGPRNLADAYDQRKSYEDAQLAATREAYRTLDLPGRLPPRSSPPRR